MPGLTYDGRGLQGTPAEIVANLQILNAARKVTYRTPGFTSVPTNPNTTAPAMVAQETKAMEKYYDAVRSGDPEAVHKCVDAVNHIREVKSGVELIPPSDFDILANAQTPVGLAARWLSGNKDDAAQVFWSDEGSKILDEYKQ